MRSGKPECRQSERRSAVCPAASACWRSATSTTGSKPGNTGVSAVTAKSCASSPGASSAAATSSSRTAGRRSTGRRESACSLGNADGGRDSTGRCIDARTDSDSGADRYAEPDSDADANV